MSSTASLKSFASRLKTLPVVLGQRVAQHSAPAVTARLNETFAAGADPFGASWAPKADGSRKTLVRTGALAGHLSFVAIGRKMRASLGVRYAKYFASLVFPRAGALLPKAWTDELETATRETIATELRVAA